MSGRTTAMRAVLMRIIFGEAVTIVIYQASQLIPESFFWWILYIVLCYLIGSWFDLGYIFRRRI